ncbi:hypothetical protein K431DRAFT_225848 [Polychaeton citri CBS 116435]|uniref:Zn(2)-C6 fungal-type domain-containing protein n=1 Tax=Polychaeton citri CBS 116435 TaxID=1314669 RepID=A0A9P4Q7M1_9PEZI|nr:hypothetical protein K431DRAFT_225848 [Polychaeton citri CBS 116435]
MELRAPRVGHKKSRNGCAQCKRRHVKCDEERPCSNCVRHGVACSLAGGPHVTRDDARPKQASTTPSVSGRSRGGSQENVTQSSLPASSAGPSGATTTSTVPYRPDPRLYRSGSPFESLSGRLGRNLQVYDHDWMLDLQLLHHYLENTQQIITENYEMTQIWHEQAPRIAFRSEDVMHALLGFSALHKAHLELSNSSVLQASAVQHMNRALVLFRQERGVATSDNADARFVFTWLVALFAYAIPPTAPPVDAMTELFMLAKGIDTVLSETWFWVVQGPFASILARGFQVTTQTPSSGSFRLILPNLSNVGIHNLDVMFNVEPINSDTRQVLLSVLAELQQIYESLLRENSQSSLATIICFPRQHASEYADLIKARAPSALVLLAYYTVLLDLCDTRWWMHGWATRVLQDLSDTLDFKWQHWIQYPVETVLLRNKPPLLAVLPQEQVT